MKPHPASFVRRLMSFQPHMVRATPDATLADLQTIASNIRTSGGVVLLATKAGMILCAFDDSKLSRIKKLPKVRFVGAVNLNPQGAPGRELQRLIQEELSRQGMVTRRVDAQ